MAASTLDTSGYKPLEEAWEKMSGDNEAVLELAVTAARIKVAHAAMAAADPTPYEFSTHVDDQRKQIVASLAATGVGGRPPQSERYAPDAMLGDSPDDLPMVHAKHRVTTATLKAKLTENDAKLTRVQTRPEGQHLFRRGHDLPK